MALSDVFVTRIREYDYDSIYRSLPDDIFEVIKRGDKVVLKPNWVKESHEEKPDEWEYVITHPAVITAVLMKVVERLDGKGEIRIIDGPQFDSSFQKIISYYPVELWKSMTSSRGVGLEIIDLRDESYFMEDEVIVRRTRLPGDPRGSVDYLLRGDQSEFLGQTRSKRGYFGAYYDIHETNESHDGTSNRYRVSKSVMECNVFINLPKLKTHKKAGITCCLKNLVGINTYRNFLPHYSEGGPADNGDQFPADNYNARFEGPAMAFIKQNLIQNETMARVFKPIKKIGRRVFGDTTNVVRSGNWHGNDTMWRTILDLNKLLLYGGLDGKMKEDSWSSTKSYIGIVDGILAGEGNGPMRPDPVELGYLIYGTNPVAIDAACAAVMGFDPLKIPPIAKSFAIGRFKICDFDFEDIVLSVRNERYRLAEIPAELIVNFKPHFGWKGFIEKT